MSSETQPIDPERFAMAIEDLPVENLHEKAAEIRNSLIHLQSSNQQLAPFAREGDSDCEEAIKENLEVMARMNVRIDLLKAEVERRGMRWVDSNRDVHEPPPAATANGDEPVANGHSAAVNGIAPPSQPQGGSGRLTDAELQRRLMERMGDLDGADDDDEGVHL